MKASRNSEKMLCEMVGNQRGNGKGFLPCFLARAIAAQRLGDYAAMVSRLRRNGVVFTARTPGLCAAMAWAFVSMV